MAWLLALIIFASVAAYLALAGVIYIVTYRLAKDRCKECSPKKSKATNDWITMGCYKEHWLGPLVLALFWPVAGWAALPAYLVDPHRSRRKAEAQQARIAALEAENADLERKLRQ